MKIVLKGNPLSTNNIYRYACRGNNPMMYMTAQGKTLKEQYAWEMQAQRKGVMIRDEIKVKVELYFKDKRKRDVDNYNKLVLDAGSGVLWEDDKQIKELHIIKYYDKDNPRIELNYELYKQDKTVGEGKSKVKD